MIKPFQIFFKISVEQYMIKHNAMEWKWSGSAT